MRSASFMAMMQALMLERPPFPRPSPSVRRGSVTEGTPDAGAFATPVPPWYVPAPYGARM